MFCTDSRAIFFLFATSVTCIKVTGATVAVLRMLIRSMEDASASLNAEASHYVVGREADCQISVPVFSISAFFPLVTFAFTFVFSHLKCLVAHCI